MGKQRTIDLRGKETELPGGGMFRILPSTENIHYQEKSRSLHALECERRGLPPDADLFSILTTAEISEMMIRAMGGTVVRSWEDFVDGNGVPIPFRDAAGHFLDDNLVLILHFPGVYAEFVKAIGEINGRHVQDTQAIVGEEGNLHEPSDGISATEGN